MTDYLEFRVFVGPHYSHYDWSTLSLGQTGAPGSDTTTTSMVNSSSTSVNVAQPSFFPNTGGVFIGPNGLGEAWEYCQFTGKSGSSLTGLVREQIIGTEHNGSHTTGAAIRWWWPLTNDGTLHIAETLDDTLGVTTWTATLQGALFPTAALRNGHICLIQTRTATTGVWTTALIGFLNQPSVEDEASKEARWNVNIVSIASILEKTRVDGVRVGELNAAALGSASASSVLTIPFDERYHGEYTAATPDLEAQSAIDNKLNSLWVSEMFHGSDNLPAMNSDPENNHDLKFSQIYVNPPIGTQIPRWFELTLVPSGNVAGHALFAANGGSSYTSWLFGGPGVVAAESRFIFTEDIDLFQQWNPLANYAAIYENADFFNYLPPTGGEIWVRLGQLNSWRSRVRWGNGNGNINHPDAPNQNWSGPTVAVPTEGETMRYIYTPAGTPTQAADYWVTDMVHYAGYQLDKDNESWFMVSLPGMGLLLEVNISSTVPGPGALLRITDASENPNTGGLDATGTLMIGSEQISYSSKNDNGVIVSARGVGGTTAAAHTKGDAVYVVSGSIATDAPAISRIELAWNGSIIGKNYLMYTSKLPTDPRQPGAANWLDDWTGFNTLVNNTSNPQINYISPSQRIKHVLVVFQQMSTDPARARLAELRAILDETKYGANAALPANTVAGTLITQILLDAGIPATAISHSGTPALNQVQTAADNAWLVVADYADFAGCKVTVARDSKISITPSTLWSSAQTPTFTWDRSSARKIKKSWNDGEGVSQVVLPWRTPANDAEGIARYPDTQMAIGSPYEFNQTLYSGEAAALISAQRRYYVLRYPATVLVDSAANQLAQRPGAIHQVNWQTTFDHAILNRPYVVIKTDHHVEKRVVTTAVELQQIEHAENT